MALTLCASEKCLKALDEKTLVWVRHPNKLNKHTATEFAFCKDCAAKITPKTHTLDWPTIKTVSKIRHPLIGK